MPSYVLIGLCEPLGDEDQAAFDEWFVDQHIEDTTKCPNFVSGRVYKLAGPHLGWTRGSFLYVGPTFAFHLLCVLPLCTRPP